MKKNSKSCKLEFKNENYISELTPVVKNLVAGYKKKFNILKDGVARIPSKESIIKIIEEIQKILFPGYFGKQDIHNEFLEYYIGNNVHKLFDLLSEQIAKSFRHRCETGTENLCIDCYKKGQEYALEFIKHLSDLSKIICEDIKAALDGDPAAQSIDEIIFSYPGVKAILIYRIANTLYKMKVPLIPRIMTESAHSETGIDIHPGAEIGGRFFIDHGTGVVIGQTTVIGDNVKIYQGVTLGALSITKKDYSTDNKIIKRHPTIEDNCVIYSGATILGGDTVIGKGSVIGGNVWLIHSLDPYTKVMSKQFELNKILLKKKNK